MFPNDITSGIPTDCVHLRANKHQFGNCDFVQNQDGNWYKATPPFMTRFSYSKCYLILAQCHETEPMYHGPQVKFSHYSHIDHKNYNFLNFDWFKKLLFPTNSLVKLLSDSLSSDSLLSDISTNQSHSKF